MMRLLRYDISRITRSLVFVMAVAATVIAGIVGVLISPGYQCVMAFSQAYLMLIPLVIVVSVFFIVQEYRYGILRSKVTSGFDRTKIVISWLAAMAVLSLLLMILYGVTVIVIHAFQGRIVLANATFGAVLVNGAMLYVMMMVYVLLSILTAVLIREYECIIIVLFVFFALAELALLFEQSWIGSSNVLQWILLVPTSHLRDSIIRVPESRGLTLVGGLGLILLAGVVLISVFRRKNLE